MYMWTRTIIMSLNVDIALTTFNMKSTSQATTVAAVGTDQVGFVDGRSVYQ